MDKTVASGVTDAGSIPATSTRMIPNSNSYVSSFNIHKYMVEYL